MISSLSEILLGYLCREANTAPVFEEVGDHNVPSPGGLVGDSFCNSVFAGGGRGYSRPEEALECIYLPNKGRWRV